MFKLEIDTSNAAFADDERGSELARILRLVADKIEHYSDEGAEGVLKDINGNTCGEWTLSVREGDEAGDPNLVQEVSGYYGSGKTPCTIYTYPAQLGFVWYAVEGSKNVNMAQDEEICNGVDVEMVEDEDTFTASISIRSAEDMARECVDM